MSIAPTCHIKEEMFDNIAEGYHTEDYIPENEGYVEGYQLVDEGYDMIVKSEIKEEEQYSFLDIFEEHSYCTDELDKAIKSESQQDRTHKISDDNNHFNDENCWVHIDLEKVTETKRKRKNGKQKTTSYQVLYYSKCAVMTTKNQSLQHHQMLHTSDQLLQCSDCHYRTLHVGHFEYHIQHHDKESPCCSCCPYCESAFLQQGDLSNHILSQHPNSLIKCMECDFSSPSPVLIYQHKKDYHLNNIGLNVVLKCTQRLVGSTTDCSFVTKTAASLKLHHEAVHSHKKPYTCAQCGYKTARTYDFNRHILSHSFVKPYSCDDCDKSFIQKSMLKVHIKTKHTSKDNLAKKRNSFSCKKCKFVSSRKVTLKLHRAVHSGKSLYQCGFCVYESSDMTSFNRHILAHDDTDSDRPYRCVSCSRSFTRHCSLLRHVKLQHPKPG